MLNRNLQRIVNIVVVLLLAGFVGFGAYMALPARSPFGPMLGKIFNSKEVMESFIATLSPESVAKAFNQSPSMASELLHLLRADLIGQAVNENSDFISDLIG